MVGRGFDDEVCSDGGVTGYGSKGGRGVRVVQSGTGPTKKGIVEIGYRINGYFSPYEATPPPETLPPL